MPPILSLVLVLAAVGLLLAAVLSVLVARIVIKPPRMTDGKALYLLRRLSPEDLGLAYEPCRFLVRDEQTAATIPIAGWWIPHPHARGRCIVLIHGYADAKVGGIAWAPMLHSLGWHILAIDLRAHGESGGRHCTAGYYERHDLSQVIDQLRFERPQQTEHIMLFGVSLGAAVAAATAAMRDDLAGAVLECPFVDFPSAVRAHARKIGMPSGGLLWAGLRVAEWTTAARFDAVRPLDLIPRARCPLMIITCSQDPLLSSADLRALQSAAPAGAAFWQAEGAPHLGALSHDVPEYRRRLDRFLTACVPAPSG